MGLSSVPASWLSFGEVRGVQVSLAPGATGGIGGAGIAAPSGGGTVTLLKVARDPYLYIGHAPLQIDYKNWSDGDTLGL